MAAADGVAVRYSDFKDGIPDFSNWKEGVDYIAADMGDDFDDNFDTVLWVEDFTFSPEGKITSIIPSDPVTTGHLIKQRGDFLRENELILKKGDLITPYRLGLLASAGVSDLFVKKKPVIAYIPSGNELIPTGNVPKRGQNIESNSLMASALIHSFGGEIKCFPIIRDQKNELESAVERALSEADIVLLNGGSSMGTEDYSAQIITEKAQYFQHGVRSIPGIPIAVALIDRKPVINLPGPPFAAWCGIDWCLRGLIDFYLEREPVPLPTLRAKLAAKIKKPPMHEMYIRLQLIKEGDDFFARPLSDKIRYAEMTEKWNALFIAPIGKSDWKLGEYIDVRVLN